MPVGEDEVGPVNGGPHEDLFFDSRRRARRLFSMGARGALMISMITKMKEADDVLPTNKPSSISDCYSGYITLPEGKGLFEELYFHSPLA